MSSCDRLLTHFHSIYVFKTQMGNLWPYMFKQPHDTSPKFCSYWYPHSVYTWHHQYKMTQPVLWEMKHLKVTNYWLYKNKHFFSKSVLQIMTALKSSSGRHPSPLQSSPGHCAAPTKAVLSTEVLGSSPQGRCSDADSVAPHSSSLPVSPCSPSAASHTDVSAA